MRLDQLHADLTALSHLGPIEAGGAPTSDVEVIDVDHDSRAVGAGSMFCAVTGLSVDGHDYVDAALDSGASALLVERFVDRGCPQLRVDNVRQAMPHAASLVHGEPSRSLRVVGITGTNGKTTTTQLLAEILTNAGHGTEVIGTLAGAHTTPESTELQRQLRTHVDAGVDFVALEVSSHALDQHRVDATKFAVAAFMNLTPDHLDYHGDMDTYFAAKRRLFDGRADNEVIVVDDRWGAALADERRSAVTVSIHDVEITNQSLAGTRFVWRGHDTYVPLPGTMNVTNALVAAESARLLGIDETSIVAGLGRASAVPGRMERVVASGAGQPTVVVDYSHTPDSIDRALSTIRDVVPLAKVSIVFGCGGDRDRLKRPLMGRAAEAGADLVYLTNDNPRTEEPLLIIADALAGISEPDEVTVEPDRREAIRRAIINAGPDDVVLIAGKGHEKTQTIGSDVLPFDDVQVARDVIEVMDA